MVTFTRPSPVASITRNFDRHVREGSANPGVDYGCPAGRLVAAPEAGVIAGAKWSNIVGWWVTVFHDNGWSSDLLHNTSISVSVGQRVARGQTVAISGGTGSVATGNHVHWSLRPNHTSGLVNRGNVNGEALVSAAPASSNKVITTAYVLAQLGDVEVKRLQSQLGVATDGIFGKASFTALQKRIGTLADGIFGHNSVVALQKFLGIAADGLWGPGTTGAVKAGITLKKFAPVVVTPPPAPYVPPTEAEYKKLLADKKLLEEQAVINATQLTNKSTLLAAAEAKLASGKKEAAEVVAALA
jgi:murein DD-endopeptidase MepM/ murein hydrolase activator NlpD